MARHLLDVGGHALNALFQLCDGVVVLRLQRLVLSPCLLQLDLQLCGGLQGTAVSQGKHTVHATPHSHTATHSHTHTNIRTHTRTHSPHTSVSTRWSRRIMEFCRRSASSAASAAWAASRRRSASASALLDVDDSLAMSPAFCSNACTQRTCTATMSSSAGGQQPVA